MITTHARTRHAKKHTYTHHKKKPPQSDVDLSKVAQLTPGLAGADLASLVNEAAIRAVRRSSAEVTMFDMDMAVKDYFRSRGTGACVPSFVAGLVAGLPGWFVVGFAWVGCFICWVGWLVEGSLMVVCV